MRVARTSESLPSGPVAPLVSASEPSTDIDTAIGDDHDLSGRAASVSGLHGFLRVLRSVGQELDRGESISDQAIRGIHHGGFSPERLIALQAGIYRYSEAVDLVTKLVDRGTQAVRTTLQNQ